MRRIPWLPVLLAPFALAAALSGCKREDPNAPGPAERFGKEVDSAVERAGEVASDAAVTSQVKAALALHKEIDALKVNVDTVDGVVTLRGVVATESAKAEAERAAATVRGVKRVVNELRVGA
jgi:hyperosmotically inducible protein